MPSADIHFLLFNTIHDVLKAEKILKREDVRFELVPVPRNLSSDCGMCIKLHGDLMKTREKIEGIVIERCFSFDGSSYIQV